jgi:hypothetical protein
VHGKASAELRNCWLDVSNEGCGLAVVGNGSSAECIGCKIQKNEEYNVSVENGAVAALRECALRQARRGVHVTNCGAVVHLLSQCEVTGNETYGIYVGHGGHVSAAAAVFADNPSGSIGCEQGAGSVALYSCQLTDQQYVIDAIGKSGATRMIM